MSFKTIRSESSAPYRIWAAESSFQIRGTELILSSVKKHHICIILQMISFSVLTNTELWNRYSPHLQQLLHKTVCSLLPNQGEWMARLRYLIKCCWNTVRSIELKHRLFLKTNNCNNKWLFCVNFSYWRIFTTNWYLKNANFQKYLNISNWIDLQVV